MNRESLGGYVPPEEIKRKKKETEMELVEMVIEFVSFSAAVPGLSLDKITTSVETLSNGVNPALGGKIEMVERTEEYGRIYEAALDEAGELAGKERKNNTKKEKTEREK